MRRRDAEAWLDELRKSRRRSGRARREELTTTGRRFIRCAIYRELAQMLDRDAIVIGDGGDFVSYAGPGRWRVEPGRWMDPGPYGCLGAGPGQAIGAKIAQPDRQVCVLLGDGAFGFSGLEFDSSPATACRWSESSATTGSGRWRSTRWSSSTGTRSPRTSAGHPLRRGGGRPRLPWRAGVRAGAAAAGPGARLRVRQAGVGKRAHRSEVVYPRKSNLA